MSAWWVLVAVILALGTLAVLWALARVLDTADDVLVPDRGLGAAAAPIGELAVDADLASRRLGEVRQVLRRRRRLLSVARPGRPWRQLWSRWRGSERHVPRPSPPSIGADAEPVGG